MEFINRNIQDYAEKHTTAEPILLQELHRETWQKVLLPRMLSGHLQGRLLSMISQIKQPQTILEIGTYTGYATICLAEGLPKNGRIYTIDKNEELVDFQKKYFRKAGIENRVEQLTGDALLILPTLDIGFDMVFLDADKKNYATYFDQIIDKINPGGILLSDNVLWSGKVTKTADYQDVDTKELQFFNQKLREDKRVQTVLLPIRDGISISVKV